MAIQRSGPIKFSEIATEFPDADRDNQAGNVLIKASEYYRGLTPNYVHSGTAGIPEDSTYSDTSDNVPLSLSDFYGTSSAEYLNYFIDEANAVENGLTLDFSDKDSGVSVIVVIGDSNNTECLDFLDNLYDNDINGWQTGGLIRGRDSGTGNPNFTGIGYVSSSDPTEAAITITNVPDNSFIWIRNFGFVVGSGGAGAEVNTGNTSQSAQTGGAGGDGIYVDAVDSTSDVLIENWGTIAGGAGGGGAGGQGGLAESSYRTYDPVANYYDSSSATANYTIANAHIGFMLQRYGKVIYSIGTAVRDGVSYNIYNFLYYSYKYAFYLVKIRDNLYQLKFKYISDTAVSFMGQQTTVTTSNLGSIGTWVSNSLTKIDAKPLFDNDTRFNTYLLKPNFSNITVDNVTFSGTNPSRTDFAAVSQAIPFSNNQYINVKNVTDDNGNSFHTVLGNTFPALSNTYGITGTNNSYYFKKAFKTLTASSNLTTNISHGGAGGQGANFVNYDSTSTTTFTPSTGSTVPDTVGITTTPNAIYHPEFKFGQGGQGGSGNYWSVTPGDATSLTLENTTATATSGENGTGLNGYPGGSQGALGTAINTSLSNVTITNY